VLTSRSHVPHLLVPRTLLAIAAALSLIAVLTVPADARQGPPAHAAAARHEIWMLDQGTDLIHVLDGRKHEEQATIDVSPSALSDAGFQHAPTGASTVPHMIEFDSRDRFAFIAATAGGVTIVVDARTKEVVEVLPTGGGSHMAAVTPDDRSVWVAVIGTAGRVEGGSQRFVEIDLDLDASPASFTLGRSYELQDLLEPVEAANGWTYPSFSPVCHQYDPAGTEAWLTLGPGPEQGGLVVLDLTGEDVEVAHAYDPEVVKANCGVSITEDRAIVNWSGTTTGDDPDGEWYVFDRSSKEHLDTRDAHGTDAHGLRLSPDGSTYWMVNRVTDNALLVDAASLEVVATIPEVAPTPDILDFSPDGSTVYITQRGPNPRSGAHLAVGHDPGIAVIDTATTERRTTLRPATIRDTDGNVLNDVHGVGVRTVHPSDRSQARAERAQRPAVVPARAHRDAAGFHCGLPSA
jgi:DNA-binding beta-propeller fold protein YncE